MSTAISRHGGHDVIVVGAGIIGAAIALELAERGLRVACAGDSAETLGTASSAAGAMLGVLGEVTAGQDDPLDEAELRLRHEAAQAWPAFAARIQEHTRQSLPINYGTFVIANILNARDTVNLAAIAAAADRLDLPHEPIAPAEVPYLQPAPGHQPISALWLPHEGYIDTSRLLPAAHTTVVTHPKISYFPDLVTKILHDTQRVTGAVLADGTRLPAETIVLAAGVGTQTLLDQIGPHTGMTARLLPGKGTSFTLTDHDQHLPHVIRTPNRDFACGTHLVPRPSGGLYLGATNRIAATPAATEQPSPGEINALIHSAAHEINTRIRTIAFTSVRHGMRPLSSDGRPLIGATGLTGLHLATGTYRNGILLAPAIANHITNHITGASPHTSGEPETDIDLFAPTAAWRPHAPDVPAVLKDGVPHIVSFVMEPGGFLPYDRKGELERVLLTLFLLAFTDDHDADLRDLRQRCATLLSGARVPETVPQIFYEMATTP